MTRTVGSTRCSRTRVFLIVTLQTNMQEKYHAIEDEVRKAPEELSQDRWSKEWRDRFSVRSGIKDLGDRLEGATDLPNRQRVMELAKQLLSLVPPITKNIEWNDEWRRKFARGLDPASPKADQYYNDPRIRS